jgi:translation elongation factor EF-Tu-like GTPase
MYHPSVNYAAVVEGAEFSIREGAKVVGVGIVIRRFDGSSK